jgi:hypothetical protein
MKKNITVFFLSIVILFSFFHVKIFSKTSRSCLITAKVLSVSEKHYDDITISKRQYKQRGATTVSMRLEILRVKRMIKGVSGDDQGVIYKKGQIINAYAYKNLDFLRSKLIYKNDIIDAEIMAVPLGEKSFSYKLSRIRKY